MLSSGPASTDPSVAPDTTFTSCFTEHEVGAQALMTASAMHLNHRRVDAFHIGGDVQAWNLGPAQVCPNWGKGGESTVQAQVSPHSLLA